MQRLLHADQVHGRLRRRGGGTLPVPPHFLAEQLMAAVDGGHCEPGPRNADNFNWPHRLREVGGKHMAAVSPGGFYHIRRRFAEVRGMEGGHVGRGLTAQRPWKTRLFSWFATLGITIIGLWDTWMSPTNTN